MVWNVANRLKKLWPVYLAKRSGLNFYDHYFLAGAGPNESRIWVEVGAAKGSSLIERMTGSNHRLIMIEPTPEDAELLRQKTAGFDNVEIFEAAIAAQDGTADFHIANYGSCSSLMDFPENVNETWVREGHPYTSYFMKETIAVTTIRLDSLMQKMGLERVYFLEIDAQGKDLEVVQSLGDRLRDVKYIQIEICLQDEAPLYDGQFTKQEADAFFDSNGFKLVQSWKQSLGRELNAIYKNTNWRPSHS